MKKSSRAKRMQRHHARMGDKSASLNMVSLMDIFTILVFFLLVSAANSDILPTPKNIKLPISTTEKIPKTNVVIMVNESNILVQGKKVADVSDVIKSKSNIIKPLLNALKKELVADAPEKTKEIMKKGVTIMGDKEVHYLLIKKIMITSAAANFVDISLAVNRKVADKS
ncbi:hypothetical protein MNBD_GAMMA07-1182 [hydrothermal vent metagenome]|uniref:Biopolymer transporter ExbD n=1 Tax=hydrothermal vent metagenome TaxID=652676 RepID=A0A3B0X3M2_9ZZZZ